MNTPLKKLTKFKAFILLFTLLNANLFAQNTLDKLGLTSATPAAAYSLRLLSSNYSGPLVRVDLFDNWQ